MHFESASPPVDSAPSPAIHSLPPTPLRILLSLIRFVLPFTSLVALSTLAGFATIGSSIGLMTASAYIISAAALHPSIAELQVAIVGVRFFGIARGVFRYLERYLSHQVTFRLLARLRLWFYQALEPLAPARLLSFRSGDLLARILGDIAALENFYVRALAPPLTALLVSLVSYLLLARFDLRLGLALLMFLALAGVALPLVIRLLSRLPGKALIEQRAALSAAAVDSLQGMADILACSQGAAQLERLQSCNLALAQTQRRMANLTGLQSAFSSLLAHLALWVVLVLAIPMVSGGQIPGVYLAVVALAALTSFEAAAPLPLAAQHLESSLQAAGRLFEVVSARPEVSDPPQPLPAPRQFSLEVKDLSFTYPGSAQPALSGLSFHLPQGQRLAIVGPSGAGKSTLVNLLLRFWEYSQGQVLLGGSELRSYAQDDLRQHIAVVSQNTYLFSASLGDNLRLAKPHASQEELLQAAQQAHLHEFIQTLPQGYDTWIGEHGQRLSAGQRQRLAIARALLHGAPLLILDEATANLDTLTERAVLESIDTLMQGRTTLVVSHRLAGMERMHQILVLDGGRIVERGRHAELLAEKGLYSHLWNLQHQILES